MTEFPYKMCQCGHEFRSHVEASRNKESNTCIGDNRLCTCKRFKPAE